MHKILYLYNVDTTWTRSDMKFLSKKFKLTSKLIKTKKCAFLAANPLLILKHDKVFCWFGSLNFLPTIVMARLLGKEIIVVAGGFDVACVPSINYGGFYRSKFSVFCRKLIFKLANKVITVSNYNTIEALNNANINIKKIKMIYHGFKRVIETPKPFSERKDQVISVGGINPETMKRKGHESFIKIAQMTPEFNFILVGKYAQECRDYIESLNIKNLTLTGFMTDKDLTNLMNDSKYYVQLSRHEAFGCSVIEAGLCGCTLITSDQSALPEVTSPYGNIFATSDLEEISNFIKRNESECDQNEMIDCFSKRYSSQNREQGLLNFVSQ